MKAKTAMIGIAAATAVAMTMYFKKNPEAFQKVKNTAANMMKKNMNMDLDALYHEM